MLPRAPRPEFEGLGDKKSQEGLRILECGRGAIAGVAVLAASLAFVPAVREAVNYFDPPKRLIWAGLAILLAADVVWSKRWAPSPPVVSSAALLGWIALRTLTRPDGLTELGVGAGWCLPILLFGLASGVSFNAADRRVFGHFMKIAASLQGVLMISQRAGLDPFFGATTGGMAYAPGRMIGTIGYHNQASDFLVTASTAIMFCARSRWFWHMIFPCVFALVALTGYRGGMLGLGFAILTAGCVIWFLRRGPSYPWKQRARAAAIPAAGLMLAVVVVSLIPTVRQRFAELRGNVWRQPAVLSRLYMWRIAWEMFTERPLTGWGAGEYARQYLIRLGNLLPPIKDHTMLQSAVYAREAHNDPLQFVAEFGIVGLFLAVVLLASVRAQIRQASEYAPFATMSAYCFSYMAVTSVFSFPWQAAMSGPMSGLLLGMACASAERMKENSSLIKTGDRLARWTLGGLAVALFLWYARDARLNTLIPERIAAGELINATRNLSAMDHRYHALVGAAWAKNREYRRALASLRLASRGFVEPLLWNNLGHTLAQLGLWEEARSIYSKWVACGIDHRNALNNLSVAEEQLGNHRAAAWALARRIQLWPASVTVNDVKRLAVLRMRSGEAKAAWQTLQRHRRLWESGDPLTVAEMENLAGTIALMLGDQEKAVHWFRSALQRCPGLETARKNLETLNGRQ